MRELSQKIKDFDTEVTFESLLTFIKSLNISDLKFDQSIVEPESEGDYGRNIISLEPFECVLINWPAGVSSAVHHHKGLFGYVLVLEGVLDNFSYQLKEGELIEYAIDKYASNGIIPEPDGVIHKLVNTSTSKRAITLHFYYPAIESFEGMRLYNLQSGAIGTLSDQAKTASWLQAPNHFKTIKEKAFQYISYTALNQNKSHLICNVIPKPSVDEINEMNAGYFSEQAQNYDEADQLIINRKAYTQRIDALIASEVNEIPAIAKHLDIATGTGRRAINIREISGKTYEIVGVDISEEMCHIAESRGLRTFHQDWANNDEHIGETFDVITFLYAFGHIANEKVRLKTLKKVHTYLKDDGAFYFDLFSLSNVHEWGPLAKKAFEQNNLSQYGYQLGDVFYRKRACNEMAFLHYFSLREIESLLDQAGFKIADKKFVGYVKNPGEIVDSEKEGNIFIKAVKR